MKRLLLLISLALACLDLSAQSEFIWGFRLYPYSGMEVGLSFGDRFGIKAISQSDWDRPGGLINTKNETGISKALGKTYRLMYGGGLSLRVVGGFWLSLEAGYGWRGKYAIDEKNRQLAVKDHIQGLDVGVSIRWAFNENWYLMAGYETMPDGFKLGRPVNEIILGIGTSYKM